MKKLLYFLILCLNVCGLKAQQPFTAGNIVVFRVGDGTAALGGNTSPVFLDEYSPAGTLVQSIAMPTAANGSNNILTARGSDAQQGMINLSGDGKWLVVPGMNLAPAAGSSSTATVIGLVDFNGKVNTSTAITNFTENATNRVRSAVSADGTRIWVAGGTAIRFTTKGNAISALINNGTSTLTQLNIANGQLYAGNVDAVPVLSVGTGLPTSASALTSLPGLPSDIAGGGQFAFADLNPAVPGMDALYVAVASGSTGNIYGIRKFSLVNGSWVSNGAVGGDVANSFYIGLTLRREPNGVTLYATRGGNNSVRGGELVKLTDNSGYNATMTGTISVMASVATANTMAFRGVALVPQPAPFTPGNIVAARTGDGTSVLGTTASILYLDEFTVDGTLVQTLQLPTAAGTGRNPLTVRGSDAAMSMITLSADGKSIVATGFNQVPGATGSGTATVIGLIDYNGVMNTSTAITDVTENATNRARSAVSDDGNRLWVAGGTGIRYTTKGATQSTLINNGSSQASQLGIANGQLYVSNSDAVPVNAVGTGLPASASALVSLPGLPSDIVGGGQFAFADLSAAVPGPDVLYVAALSGSVGTIYGIRKFSLVGGAWVDNGSVGGDVPNSWYIGLTLRPAASGVTLFATRGGINSSARGGEIVRILDASGYNATMTGTPQVIVSVATANTMAYRGIVRVPVGCATVSGLRVPDVASTRANVLWTGAGSYEYAVTISATPPASGTATTSSSLSLTNLTNNTTYYVHVRTVCSITSSSEWTSVSFTTGCTAPSKPLVSVSVTPAGVATGIWNTVFGAAGYEYAVTTTATPPASGAAITDTSVTLANINSVTSYYLHVRSNCGGGAVSGWTTYSFNTGCFTPQVRVIVAADKATANWSPVINAKNYQYALMNAQTQPLNGVSTIDTFYNSGSLLSGARYYINVRAVCNNGINSDWKTLPVDVMGIDAYPNPVVDVLTVRLTLSGTVNGEIVVGDASGRIVTRVKATSSVVTIPAKGWASGIYLVRFSNGTYSSMVRVVKQ